MTSMRSMMKIVTRRVRKRRRKKTNPQQRNSSLKNSKKYLTCRLVNSIFLKL